MTVYYTNTPLANEQLRVSQPKIKINTDRLNTVFLVDHYTYSDGTANAGKHNQVTTPLITGSAHPTTAANEPKFYGMQDTAALGVLQYSRGGSDAVPSPLTRLQSTAAAITLGTSTSTPVIDLVGITFFMGVLYAFGTNSGNRQAAAIVIGQAGTVSITSLVTPASALVIGISGSVVTVANNSASTTSNIRWTLDPLRIQV